MSRPRAEYSLELTKQQEKNWVCKLASLYVLMLGSALACANLGIETGSCWYGTPSVLYAGYAGLLGLLVLMQLLICCPAVTSLYGILMLLLQCLLGVVEGLDFFTNLQQVSLATLCDAEFHGRWLASFENPLFVWMEPAVVMFHLGGLLAIWVVLAYFMNMWYAYIEGKTSFSLVSALTHLLGFRYVLSDDHYWIDQGEMLWFGYFQMIVTAPILYLQTALFANTFDFTDDNTKIMQLASIFLSMCSATILLLRTVGSYRAYRKVGAFQVILFSLFVIGVIVHNCGRVQFSYWCMDHVWTIIDGCIWDEMFHGSGAYFGKRTVLPPTWEDAIYGTNHTHWKGKEYALSHLNLTDKLGYDPADIHHPHNITALDGSSVTAAAVNATARMLFARLV